MGVAKGGYQQRRIVEKKQQEKLARRRARRNKLILTWTIGSIVGIGIIVIIILALTGGSSKPSLANSSASPSPSAATSPSGIASGDACHTPDPGDLGKKSFSSAPCQIIDPTKNYTATVVTSMGTMTVKLLAKDAPETVNSFVFLSQQKFYDGLTFHRVIPDFGGPGTNMIQGGDPQGTGTGGPGYEFKNENGIPFDKPGFLAMANSGPNTNGSQFFFLDGAWSGGNAVDCTTPRQGCYTVFGQVLSGMDVIKKIASTPRDAQDKPKTPVTITSITIQES